jgi:ribonucleotide reductase alpha subunit
MVAPVGATSVYQKFSPRIEADMAYVERRESSKGTRYRGHYKAADGRYRSAGTYDTEERALEVAQTAEKHAA